MKSKKQEIKIEEKDIFQFLDNLIQNIDINLLRFSVKEITEGRILLPWRIIKSRKSIYKCVATRDAFSFQKAIYIQEWNPNWGSLNRVNETKYKICFASKSTKIISLFISYIKNNIDDLLLNPNFKFQCGQEIRFNNLYFTTCQAAQDFCDKILTSGNYRLL